MSRVRTGGRAEALAHLAKAEEFLDAALEARWMLSASPRLAAVQPLTITSLPSPSSVRWGLSGARPRWRWIAFLLHMTRGPSARLPRRVQPWLDSYAAMVVDSQPWTGPAPRSAALVNATLLCERVLQEADGTLSAIRIIDQVTLEPIPEGLPPDAEIVPAQMAVALLVVVKDPSGPSTRHLRVQGRSPKGTTTEVGSERVRLRTGLSPVAGANFIVNLNLGLRHEGMYWFDVFLDEKFLSSVPLHVRFGEPT